MCNNINEYDLVDEAKNLIQKLRDLLSGEIMGNSSKLESLFDTLRIYSDNAVAQGKIDLDQLHDLFSSQLMSLKELAEASGRDISVCLKPLQDKVTELYDANIETLPDCSSYGNRQMQEIEDTAIYHMNTLMNEIEYLNYQIDRCQGEFLCISPIVTEIDLAMISIPQKVETEVDKAGILTENLKPLLQSCIKSKVGQLSSWGLSIVNDATEDCIQLLYTNL